MVRIFNVLMFLAVACALVLSASAEAASKNKRKSAGSPNTKYGSIVIDAETGAILAQAGADKVLHPASLTKLMTLSLTFDAIDKGTLRPNDRIKVSRRAASMMPSKIGLKAGETIRVQDAVNAVITKSANDMSVALAEAVGGSEPNFARLMNAKAATLGMNRSRFVNASGLHDSRQVSTPRDMAKLARYMISGQSKYYPLFNRKSFTYAGRTYTNHNRMLGSYAGMDGMKTGYVNASGFNLVASAKRGDSRLIAVVFGGQSAASRNLHMASLLDGGFISMNNIRLAQQKAQNSRIASAVSVPGMGSAGGMPANATAAQPAPVMASLNAGTLTLADQAPQASPAAPVVHTHTPSGPAVTTTRVSSSQRSQGVQLASLSVATDAAPLGASQVALQQPATSTGGSDWAIQVGAFQSRLATDQAIYQAQHKLPSHLGTRATPMIVPLRTAEASWVFRARLAGFATQAQAQQACAHLGNCLVIPPQAN